MTSFYQFKTAGVGDKNAVHAVFNQCCLTPEMFATAFCFCLYMHVLFLF
jgi:hypothetical protein